jgi:nitroimidazol reductase NimA-like FMN-containing flavoprotein (pyridoxamine 5'-phosphate oxidase superfamily)
MPTTDADRTQAELGRAESLRLLGTAGIGRLAYTRAALPAIRPVSFSLQGGDLLIPVGSDGGLIGALRGSIVAFETDAYDESSRTGWTVLVVGPSRVLGRTAGRGAETVRCVVAVRMALVQGLRTGLPA